MSSAKGGRKRKNAENDENTAPKSARQTKAATSTKKAKASATNAPVTIQFPPTPEGRHFDVVADLPPEIALKIILNIRNQDIFIHCSCVSKRFAF